jgi:putative transposase
MIGRQRKLSLRRQCCLLGLDRSGLYYEARGESRANIELMHRVDELYTAHPYYGVRRMVAVLERQGVGVNAKRVRRLMRLMGLEAIYPKPRLSQAGSTGQVFPYLLRNLAIERVHQVWAIDITYIRLRGGFGYLAAIIDWFSRYVLAWELSNRLEVSFCLEVFQAALRTNQGCLAEILNSDQGCQFTSQDWIAAVQSSGMQVSHDGRGRALDNVMVERLWRSVKYENVYLHDYNDLPQARQGLSRYFEFYNFNRPHQALEWRTPFEILEANPRNKPNAK